MQQTNKPYTFRWARELSVSSLTYEKENATILGTAESLGLYKRNLDLPLQVNRVAAADALFHHLLYVTGIRVDELQAMPVMDAIGLLNKSTDPQVKGVTLHDAAMFFEDGAEHAATNLVTKWINSRKRLPPKFGKCPQDGRRNLSEIPAVLDFLEKEIRVIKTSERTELRDFLRQKKRPAAIK